MSEEAILEVDPSALASPVDAPWISQKHAQLSPEFQIRNIFSKTKWCFKVLSHGVVCYAARDNWNREYKTATTTIQEGCRRVREGKPFSSESQEVGRDSA